MKKKQAKHEEAGYVVYDPGIQFLQPYTGPVLTDNREDAEKVMEYMNEVFDGQEDNRGHQYKYKIIPIPEGVSEEAFVKSLIGWAFEFDEWAEYGRDYWHHFGILDELEPDGSIRSLYHIKEAFSRRRY